MRIACREAAIGSDHVELFIVHELENRLVTIQTVARGEFPDLFVDLLQFGSEVGHGYLPLPALAEEGFDRR